MCFNSREKTHIIYINIDRYIFITLYMAKNNLFVDPMGAGVYTGTHPYPLTALNF
jgi:hypothetical protein